MRAVVDYLFPVGSVVFTCRAKAFVHDLHGPFGRFEGFVQAFPLFAICLEFFA
jgi:hypothetical protein